MSDFTDLMAADLGNVFFNTDEFAVEAVYTPEDTGVGKSIDAQIEYGVKGNSQGIQGDGYTWTLTCQRDVRSNFDHGRTRNVATVIVKASDVPDPQYRDTVDLDGVTWIVAEIFDG